MNKQPLVSVLIAAYNVERYIDELLNSVINQTYKNLEVIIVNDGSKDNTENIINKFIEKDSRIRLINNQKNMGFIHSLNVGLPLTKGEFIARTDADDIVKPDWIEKIVKAMENNPEIIAMGSYLEIISDSGLLTKYNKTGDIWRNPLDHNSIIREMLFRNPIHNNTMIMRKEVYHKYKLTFNYDYKHAEDYKFWYDVSKLGKLANYPEVLCFYRFHSEQTSSLYATSMNYTARKIRREIRNDYFCEMGFKTNINFDDLRFENLNKFIGELMESKIFLVDYKNIVRILFECFLAIRKDKFKVLFFLLSRKSNIFTKEEKNILIAKTIKKIFKPYKIYGEV